MIIKNNKTVSILRFDFLRTKLFLTNAQLRFKNINQHINSNAPFLSTDLFGPENFWEHGPFHGPVVRQYH